MGVPFEGVVGSEDYGFVFYDVYLFRIVGKETSSDFGACPVEHYGCFVVVVVKGREVGIRL